MWIVIDLRVDWKLDPIKEVERVDKQFRNRIIRIGMNKACGIVKKAIAEKAKQDTGTLVKSLRIKVKSYKAKSAWVGVVGPKGSYTRTVGNKVYKPSRYASLLEFGTSKMAKRPFLKPALDASKGQYLSTLIAKIREQVEATLKKA